MQEYQTDTLVIGASLAGLACAACLQKQQTEYIIIEKENKIASPWHHHYDRLHLHTSKSLSHLPFKRFGKNIAKYPSRKDVTDYLSDYQKEFNIHPRFHTRAISVKNKDRFWLTETDNGWFRSNHLIMATGAYSKPKLIDFPGMETFQGRIIHSYQYKTGRDFASQKVLVVGFGNSACEIAIDLYEQGAMPAMSVRSPVNVIPRDIFGIPVSRLSVWLRHFPPGIADRITAPMIKFIIGDISGIGLEKKSYGPLEQMQKDGSTPVLDIGTIAHIRKGHITIKTGIDHINRNTLYFKDGSHEDFDVIVAAIGYYRDYADIVDADKCRFDDLQVSCASQKYFGKDGLYFCGYRISQTGQIRQIAGDAKRIARDILRRS